MQKKHWICLGVISGLIIILLLVAAVRGCTKSTLPTIDTTATLVKKMTECSRIYTTEISIHKIVTHNDNVKMEASALAKLTATLPFGKRKIAMPISATLKTYVDLGALTAENVKRTGNKIEIILPDPKIVMTSSKIDHDNIVKVVPWLRTKFSDEELDSYARQGRADILASFAKMDYITIARRRAARVIVPLIEQMGYKEQNITVTFRKDFTPEDIQTLVENN